MLLRRTALPAILLSALAFLPSSADDARCAPRHWSVSVAAPNVLDADTYVTATTILLDDAGTPTIFYSRGPAPGNVWTMGSAELGTGSWRNQALPTEEGGTRPAVAADASGAYHVAWRTGTFFGQGILRYAKVDEGGWHEEIVDPTPGATNYVTIAVDASGNPGIVYSGELAGMPMRFAHWNGSVWESEIVETRGGILSPSLVFGVDGAPRVAYARSVGAEVDYATRERGFWTNEPVAIVSPDQALEISLALDLTGQAHVAYDQLYDTGIHYGTRSGVYWTTEVVEPGQRWDPALAFDAEDVPQIVFYDAEHGALVYATPSAAGWCRQTIEDHRSESIRIGRNPAIAVDGGGGIHVSYHYHREGSPCQIRYAVSE